MATLTLELEQQQRKVEEIEKQVAWAAITTREDAAEEARAAVLLKSICVPTLEFSTLDLSSGLLLSQSA